MASLINYPKTETESGHTFSVLLPKKSYTGKVSFFKDVRDDLKESRKDTRFLSLSAFTKCRKPMEEYCTGSRYIGQWNALGFSGDGIYRYPHGVIYKGNFSKTGKFHGLGLLVYPNGQRIQGIWKHGKLTDDISYLFSCGDILDEQFSYCQMPDRRFKIEIERDFAPAGQEFLTNEQPTRTIPERCYDTEEGFYDPVKKCIIGYDDKDGEVKKTHKSYMLDMDEEQIELIREINSNVNTEFEGIMNKRRLLEQQYVVEGPKIMEICNRTKERWIQRHCRKAWDEPVGYKPDLYETWMVGRKDDVFWTEYTESLTSFDDYSESFIVPESTKLFTFIQMPQGSKHAIQTKASARKYRPTGAMRKIRKRLHI